MLVAIPSRYLYLTFALMAIAAFTKSAQLPFQSWLIGAMVAPTPVSALLHSSTMVNAGVYLVLRMAPAIQGTYLTYGIAFIGIFSFMVTAIIALSQKLSKKILAYSTIGNLGLIIFCAAMNTPLSYSAATILLVFHSMSKGLLFMCAGVIENRLHTRQIEEWKGLISRLPVTATITMVGMVSMFLPLFGVLLGKWAAIGITATAPLFLSIVMIAMMVIGSSATTLFWAKWLGHFAITPMSDAEPSEENLSATYKLSLYSILGLDIAASLGSGLVLNRVVAPIVALNYGKVWDTGILVLSSQVGAFMILPLWGALAAVFIVGGLIFRSKGGVIKPPYMSGENVEGDPEAFRSTADGVVKYQIAGMFFDPNITEARWVPYSTLAGVFLNMILLALVIL
jgi:ech hydrogenase subunit A